MGATRRYMQARPKIFKKIVGNRINQPEQKLSVKKDVWYLKK
jgi:hypothetical protein